MSSFLTRLKDRKLAQWALAYLAGAWALLEAFGFAADTFLWPQVLVRILTILCVLGFFLALVLAWYHGEKGRQRVSGPELINIAILLGLGGLGLSLLGGQGERSNSLARTADEPEAGTEDVATTFEEQE